MTRRILASLVLLSLLSARPARADTTTGIGEPLSVSWGLEGGIVGGTLAGSILYGALMPVDTTKQWSREILPFDERVKQNFSSSAASLSDAMVALTVAMPLTLQLGRGFDEEMGKSTFVYAETLAAALVFNTVVKYSVQRPRPYTYSRSPEVQAYLATQRRLGQRDSHLSFYSGHATVAFASAIAGSYLFAQTSRSTGARATVWGVELALAAGTANLRVRAGKHFYSDVILGALIGVGLGIGLPLAHGGPEVEISTAEWITIGCAPVIGAVASQLVPFKRNVTVAIDPEPARVSWLDWLNVYPWMGPSSAGLAAGGRL